MKVTKSQLKQLIQEEIHRLHEVDSSEQIMAAIQDIPKTAQALADRVKKEIEGLSEQSNLDPLVLAQAVAALLTSE